MAAVACRWAKPTTFINPTSVASASTIRTNLKDIMSEQVALQISSEDLCPRRVVHQQTAHPDDDDEGLRLALEASSREAAEAGVLDDFNAVDALLVEQDSTANDLALALALAEEEAPIRGTPSVAQALAANKVAIVTQAELHARDAVAARQKPVRRLLSAEDAPDQLETQTGIVLQGGAPVPSAHLSVHDVDMLCKLAEEEDEEALLLALRGRVTRGRNRLGLVREDQDEYDELDGGGILTKHDAELNGRHNARQLEKDLGPSAGDMSGLCVPQSATVGLKRHIQKQSVKGASARGRVEGETFATDNSVWNARTRMALMKLINSGRLERIAGVCKVGKEASVYLGLGWDHAAHADLSTDGWAGQRSRVWDDVTEAESDCEEEISGGEAEDDKVNLETSLAAAGGILVPTEPEGADADTEPASETDVAVKIFKLSLAEFKDRRMYMDGDRRYAHTKLKHQNARKLVPIWAEKEFKNLIRVHRAGIPSPAPLLLRNHIIVMSFIGRDGWPAPQLREAPIQGPREWARVYRQVVAIMSAMYKWTHLVHADLSEYNLLYWQRQVYVLDLGQAVDTSHPLSRQFLENDVRNVTSFFGRKGVVVLSDEALLGLITNTAIAPRPSCGRRTGAHDTHVPAVGSGVRPLELLVEQARVAALSGAEPVFRLEETNADGPGHSNADFYGDYFSGENNPIAEAVDTLLTAASTRS